MTMTNTINQALTHDRLQRLAPSIFQSSAMDGLSGRYNFIPTITLINEMEHSGWLPVKAIESTVRNESKRGYQKHMIRFRNFDETVNDKLEVGDNFIEMVLTNSHDGLSCFVFNLGIFRLVCSNGMVVPESCFDAVHIRHSSYDAANVIDLCGEIVDAAPDVIDDVKLLDSIYLTRDEQLVFARAAKALRFDDPDAIDTERILRPNRLADSGYSIWKTFNRVQENLEKGGVMYDGYNEHGRYVGQRRTREVKSIDGGIKLNKALWQLADEMAKLKIAN